ncbi:MAG: hypothetical protein JRI23_11185 [Deltaproteobacteria bacterium]|jgi:hypothetical protein|nr:hypothetical protein [Deltaproteobacteria bacterium]MBW2532258.1 hypothetical protein [Deltaproteobacteria bacterium]
MGWTVLARLAVVLAGCTLAGCTDKSAEIEQSSHRVSAASTADARAAVVDESRRFELGWPGPGWKLLHPEEASELVPGAVAGALSEHGLAAVLLVEPMGKRSSGDVAAQLLARLALDAVEVQSNEPTKVGTRDARRFALRGKAAGVPLRYAGWVLPHEGHAFVLIGWGSEGRTAADASWLEPVLKALSLEDGAVKATKVAAPLPDARGVGWQLVDGVLHSALVGAKVKPPEGWQLLVGPSLLQVDLEAAAGLRRDNPEVVIHLRNEPVPARRRVALLDRLAKQLEVDLKLPAPPERVSFELGGEALPMLRYAVDKRVVFHGVRMRGDHAVHVVAYHPAADAARGQGQIGSGLAAISLLSDQEQASLTKVLADGPAEPSAVGPSFAIRGGKYLDFEWQLSWKKPEGFWRLAVGEMARQVNRDALLYAHEPRLGLHALLIVEPTQSATLDDYHTKVTERLQALVGLNAKAAEPTAVDEVEARVSEGDAGAADRRLRYRVVTTVHDDRAVQLLVWGWPEIMAARAEQVTAAVQGLTLQAPLPKTEQRAGIYRDFRMGFELQPPEGWEHQDLTPPELAPQGTFVRWGRDGRWVAVLAVSAAEVGNDPQWLVGWIAQQIQDEVGRLTRGALQGGTVTVAGRTAQRMSWAASLQQVDGLVLRHGATIFALLSVDRSPDARDLLSQRFVLLP